MARKKKPTTKGNKTNKSNYGTVYFIHAQGTRRYKIGLTTREFSERLKELNSTQSPYPLVPIKTILVKDVKSVEAQLHKQFGEYRKHGEWFELNDNQVKQVSHTMMQISNGYNSPGRGIKEFIIVGSVIATVTLLFNYCQNQQPQLQTVPNQTQIKN